MSSNNNKNNNQNTRQFRLTRSTMGLNEVEQERACDGDEESNAAVPKDSFTSSLGIVIAPCSTQRQDELNTVGDCGGRLISSDDNNEAVGRYSTTEILMKRSMHSVTYQTPVPADSSAEISELCLYESEKPVTQCITSTTAMPTAHYRQQLEKYRNEVAMSGGDAAQINFELNGIFLKRLEDIDCQSDGDLNLRLVTYQEWVDLLLHINNVIFGNISQMETETSKRIRECFCKLNCDQEQSQDENRKLRKDICGLIKIIQGAYHKNCWNFSGVNFETLSVQQVLGIPRHQCPENRDGGDMDQHMKALACEVAQKYDEICLLRSQIICLESDIQTAHQKIIFKDETIAGLREKLEQLEEEHDQQQNKMPANDACCKLTAKQHQKLIETDNFECELHQILEKASEQNSENKYQSLELHRKRLACLFDRISEDRNNVQKKLCFLRNKLVDLESDRYDDGLTSAEELDPDDKLVEQIRKRLHCLNDANKTALCKSQQLEMELNDLQRSYNSDKCINDINCRILKELADLISEITGRDFTYDESYTDDAKGNPFSEAFLEVYNNFEAKQQDTNELHDMQKQALKGTAKSTTTKSSSYSRKAPK